MLNNSFVHLPSVGDSTEKKIWKSGVSSMEEFLLSSPRFLSKKKQNSIKKNIILAKDKLKEKDIFYFYNNLPVTEHWRLFKEYRGKAVYIDIETTGLELIDDIITTIVIYDGRNIRYYINGINLHEFPDDIKKYDMIVTYNGKKFDIPFLEHHYQINVNQAHLDLRYILKSLGYSGGLKSCEKELGIGRIGSLSDIDGLFAVYLWKDYIKNGNDKALETLLAYNIEDVLNLEYLMVYAYNKKLESIPLNLEKIPFSVKPKNFFDIDISTVKKIQNQYYF